MASLIRTLFNLKPEIILRNSYMPYEMDISGGAMNICADCLIENSYS